MTTGPNDRHAPDGQPPDEHSERRALARLLPPPPHPELGLERRRTGKEFLLNEIDRDHRPSAPARAPRHGRRLALVTAVAAVAAVTVVFATRGGGTPAGQAPPATAASVRLLDRIAQAAFSQPQAQVRDDQYSYLKTVGHSVSLSEGEGGTMERDIVTEDLEQWTAVDGRRPGLQRGAGGDRQIPAQDGGALNSPTYRLLAGLPTDPEALLKQVYADADRNHGPGSGSTTGPDQEAFVTIGDLLRSSTAPAPVSAALYRAAGRIPGVTTVDDAVDAAGRHGVAVARVHGNERDEWIFDSQTLHLLGERTVLLKDGPWGKAGDEVTSIAIVARGIADASGEAPGTESNI
ncbi:CU044_5270 family protein [Kitasatospora sp. NPDC057198]|uniref:CU044_5270 family protein n=1 Tax=Kitasatospora sp. NPDC057198 TaxID=3346046 RepID=UPI00363E1847